jgi:hypothetical protein
MTPVLHRGKLRLISLASIVMTGLKLIACSGGASPSGDMGGTTPSPEGAPLGRPSPDGTTDAASPSPVGRDQAGQQEDRYLDDRSSPEQVIRSYYNAINAKQYVRAYSYWESGADSSELPPFPEFADGYADTESVALVVGQIGGDVGAGQLYYSGPVLLTATMTDGSTQRFVGCYSLHLGRPSIQAVPPYQPMAIRSASIQTVADGGETDQLLGQACEGQAASSASPGSEREVPSPVTVDGAR